MEPRQTGPSGFEHAPEQPGEFQPTATGEQLAPGFERAGDRQPEVGSVQAEAVQLAMPTLPVPVTTTNDDDDAVSLSDTSLLVANDDDLIEKEWVDKAKKIIADTKDNPFQREREISKLQIEYVRKRYGRVIGDVGN